MHFELLSPITQIETFAVGSQVRETSRLRKLMAEDIGAREMALPKFAFLMAPSISQKFTGMRPRE